MKDCNLVVFVRDYLVAALWTATNEAGEALDGEYTIEDFNDETWEKATADCAAFCEANAGDLGGGDGQHGHDFWLTRCGHGAGFWDRGYGAAGERLSAAAGAFGERYVFEVGDGSLGIE